MHVHDNMQEHIHTWVRLICSWEQASRLGATIKVSCGPTRGEFHHFLLDLAHKTSNMETHVSMSNLCPVFREWTACSYNRKGYLIIA